MPLPGKLAQFNRLFFNKLMRPLAQVTPGFGVLHHRGRQSGMEYTTPLNVFRDGDRLVVPLAYGSDVDWVKNARAATDSYFLMSGKRVRVGPPVDISTEEGMAVSPAPVTAVFNILHVTGFVAFPVID